ncbi:MAG: Hsp20/alpha crystallin family protein, partial [Desulfobacteraceae bacterium]|nr:Hsp20/alpha crystallin family protein [Desulfobacteraceae bacterium]
MAVIYTVQCGIDTNPAGRNEVAGKNDIIEELKAMKERMEDIFFRSVAPGEQGTEGEAERSDNWIPLTDILDTGKELLYTMDLPGVLEENLEVECKDERLWISGSRREAPQSGEV